MFFDLKLLTLRERGKFAKCWLAATLRHRNKLTRLDIISTKIPQICDEIMNYLNSRSGNPQKRFSLYLAATLIYGTVVIYDQQVNIFQSDVLTYVNRGLYLKKHGLNIIDKSSKRGKTKKRTAPTKEQKEIAALQEVSNTIFAEAGTVMDILEHIIPADNATITMVEDPRPILQPLPYEGGFGDEGDFDIQLRTIEEVISESMRSPRTDPTMEVVADINQIPSIVILSTTTDANPLTPHRKRRKTGNDSESSPSKVRRTLFQADLNAVVPSENTIEVEEQSALAVLSKETIVAPPYTSTPVSPQQQKKNSEKETNNNIVLQSLLDITPAAGPETKGKKRKKLSFVDLLTIIPTADMPYIREEAVTTQTTIFKCVNPKPGITCNDLFVRPARKILFQEILNKFRFEVSARTHNSIDPSMALDVNKTPVMPETLGGSLSALSIEAMIADISSVPQVINTVPLNLNSEIAQSLPGDGLNMRPPTSLPGQDNGAAITLPMQAPSEAYSRETASVSTEFTSRTKSAKIKRDTLENMKNYWRKGDSDILFDTLCPRTTINRLLAAVIFSFLLELEAKKYILTITMPNSTQIYKIRKVDM